MEESVFTKIVKGELPSHKVYEDEKTLAFLEILPKTDGHTLVISKVQVESIWDLTDQDYEAVMQTVRKVARHLKQVLKTRYVGIEVTGVDIPHVHVHLIPFNDSKEFLRIPDKNTATDHKRLAELAKELYFE